MDANTVSSFAGPASLSASTAVCRLACTEISLKYEKTTLPSRETSVRTCLDLSHLAGHLPQTIPGKAQFIPRHPQEFFNVPTEVFLLQSLTLLAEGSSPVVQLSGDGLFFKWSHALMAAAPAIVRLIFLTFPLPTRAAPPPAPPSNSNRAAPGPARSRLQGIQGTVTHMRLVRRL